MDLLMVWGVAVAGLAVGMVLATVFFRVRASAIIDSAVALGRASLEVEVADQASRARSAETDLLAARLEVQRMEETADGWRRALESLGEERARLSERASRVATLEADAARQALQMRLTEEEMRRLAASEGQKEQLIATLREQLQQQDAQAAALQNRLDTTLRLLHQSHERRAALDEQVARFGPLERQLSEAHARHAELRNWARSVLDDMRRDLQAWQASQTAAAVAAASAAPAAAPADKPAARPAAGAARRHSPARAPVTRAAVRRRLRGSSPGNRLSAVGIAPGRTGSRAPACR